MDIPIAQLEPLFDFDAKTGSDKIIDVNVGFTFSEKEYSVKGEIRLDYFPKPSIHLYFHLSRSNLPLIASFIPLSYNRHSLDIDGVKTEGFVISVNDVDEETAIVKWCPKREPVILHGETIETSYIVFHIFNFHDFSGTHVCRTINGKTVSLLKLGGDKYSVDIQALDATETNVRNIIDTGAPAITHVGILRKTDGTLLSLEESTIILGMLGWMLSFAMGSRCLPVCSVGFSSSGDRCCMFCSSPDMPNKVPSGWFDKRHGTQLAAFFSGFSLKWENLGWREALRETFHWYLIGSDPSDGVEPGIILSQTAIERLCFEYFVNFRKTNSRKEIDKLSADKRCRKIFSELNIPLELKHLALNFTQLAISTEMTDVPKFLADVRNDIIHPTRDNREKYMSGLFDAWKLSMAYLELTILAICEYRGTYGNRMKRQFIGEVEDVPWL